MLAIIIIIVILSVVLLTSLGVLLKYEDEAISFDVWIGPVKKKILPADGISSKKSIKKAEKKAVKRAKKESKQPEEKKTRDKDAIVAFIRLALKSLGRLRKKISVDILRIYWLAAADDPYDAALQFGYVSAAMGTLTPLIDGAFKIREKDFRTNLSFDTPKSVVFVELNATIQVWEILYITLIFGTEYLIMRHRLKRSRAEEERKNDNGKRSN